MLLQFSVENFKSFRDKAVLSLEASADKELPDNCVSVGKGKYLKIASVFGANAAGKSNLFQALTAAILTVRQSNNRQVNEPMFHIMPFKFDEACRIKPTVFEFVFIAGDKRKYVYGFSATRKKVFREYLYVYRTAKASVVFERDAEDKYTFTSPSLKRQLHPLTERNTSNKLFLATATAWNCEDTKAPYLWLDTCINTYSSDFDQLIYQTAPLFESDADDSLKRFTTKLLHEADIQIDDYSYESNEETREQFLQGIPKELRGFMSSVTPQINKRIRIETTHTVEENGLSHRYTLSLQEESRGTQNLFMFSPILKRAFETGETLCIDEFDASIHPTLIIFLLGLFNDPSINRNNAQLIISAHNMSIMSQEYMRRDQIYFIEKDRSTGASELFSLDEFSPRKEENIRKAYLLGRYGAVPDISEGADLWQ